MARGTKERPDRPVRDLGGRGRIRKRSEGRDLRRPLRPAMRQDRAARGLRRLAAASIDPAARRQAATRAAPNPCADRPLAHHACLHFNLALALTHLLAFGFHRLASGDCTAPNVPVREVSSSLQCDVCSESAPIIFTELRTFGRPNASPAELIRRPFARLPRVRITVVPDQNLNQDACVQAHPECEAASRRSRDLSALRRPSESPLVRQPPHVYRSVFLPRVGPTRGEIRRA